MMNRIWGKSMGNGSKHIEEIACQLGNKWSSSVFTLNEKKLCNREEQIWLHIRSVLLPVLSHAGSAPFTKGVYKTMLPEIHRIDYSQGSDL